jgi:hypothetical protein
MTLSKINRSTRKIYNILGEIMSYFERFVQWQNYVHYALNAVFLSVYYSLKFQNGWFGTTPIAMGVELAIALFISDSLVHAIFWILPKPFLWVD